MHLSISEFRIYPPTLRALLANPHFLLLEQEPRHRLADQLVELAAQAVGLQQQQVMAILRTRTGVSLPVDSEVAEGSL